MIEATPDITAQLVRIKHTFQSANTFATKADPASRVVATILMDYVAESALKTVYCAHPTTAPTAKEVTFPELLKAVATVTGTPPTLPLQSEIGNLHRQRNDTQHRNLVPSAEDVPRHAAYVEAFLRDLFTRFFAVDFDTLTLASLILDPGLRDQLESAEAHLVAGRHREAVEEAAKALHKAGRMAGDVAGVAHQGAWTFFMTSTSSGWNEFSRGQQQVLQNIGSGIGSLTAQLQETLRALAVGGDWEAYMRYRQIAPRVFLTFGPTADGLVNVDHNRDDYSKEEARAVFDYALNHILRLEAMGALSRPTEEE